MLDDELMSIAKTDLGSNLLPHDFVALLSASHICVLIHEAVSKDILWANPAACRMLEFSLEEIRPLKANHMSSQAKAYNRTLGRAWLQRAVDEGSSWIEWHYRSKSGRVIPTEAVATLVQLTRGPVVMVQFRDIEHEQSLERSLQRTEEYFHALARHTSAGAVALTEDGVIEYASQNALLQFRLEADDVIGHRIGELCLVTNTYGERGWEAAMASARPVSSVRMRIEHPALGDIWLGGSLDRLPGDDEDILLLTMHDITDRVVRDIAASRAVEYENYLSRYNAMGDMAMAIAHELGQPLAAASNFLAGVRMRAGSGSEVDQPLEAAQRQIDRASAIVGALREFVGHLEQVQALVDLNDVVRDSLHFIRIRAQESGVDLIEDLTQETIPVHCERVLTGQVVMNLCFNAIDEMRRWPTERRWVRVSTSRESGHGWVGVEDQGEGLADLGDERIFRQPFTSKEHGSGIGLALSYRIVTRQHGQMFARSREPQGSVFSFSLPLADDPDLTADRS